MALLDEQTPLLSPPIPHQGNLSTPLLKLQIGIILALQLVEPVASQSIYPYINQLVSELDITGGDDRKESLFFATQAMTVIHWSWLSDYVGRKPVLLVGLVGSSLSMLCFGLSRTFWTLVISRCVCGFLNGNAGVIKSGIADVTDSTNRAEVFSLMAVIWSTGTALGALIGGSFVKPHERFPVVFKSQFWKDFPYFLPCLVVAGLTLFGILVAILFLEETFPKHKRITSTSSQNRIPIRNILVYRVIITIANYVSLAFLGTVQNTLVPLFFAMPIEFGGMGFDPPTIGYIWATVGTLSGVFNAFFLANMIRRFGEKSVFCAGMVAMVPTMILMPIMNLCAHWWGLGVLVWTQMAMVVLLLVLRDASYGPIFIYITASAPKHCQGATNGISQMAVSVARAIGPALSTSAFSYTIQHNILGGNGVYVFLTILSLFALVLATRLPDKAWIEEGSRVDIQCE